MRRVGACVLMASAGLGLAGCESTQDRSARLERDSPAAALDGGGLVVTQRSKDVRVGRTAVLQDDNGSAAVVELRNRSRRALASVPVSINVRGRDRRSLYKNDAGGLEESLVGAAVLRPRERLLWVHDQVTAAERPRSVKALVGAKAKPVRGKVPRLRLSNARLEADETSGISARGKIENRSKILQRRVVVFAVARRGGRIVAAGRGQVARIPPGRRANFTVFFIGDPRGARLQLAAPPTILR